jgi:hypothetical protein
VIPVFIIKLRDIMNERRSYVKRGKRASKRGDRAINHAKTFDSYWEQPCDKLSKRLANKRVRQAELDDNMDYKKLHSVFYWS